MPVLKDRRFRDMSLTEEDAEAMACTRFCYVDDYERFVARAKRLLPLWRQWGIERDRLWFALIGLGLDIEGDDRDMPRAEMRKRISDALRSRSSWHHVDFVLRELAKR